MPETTPEFEIDDTKTLDENYESFCDEISNIDSVLGPILKAQLQGLVDGDISKADVWDALKAAAEEAES